MQAGYFSLGSFKGAPIRLHWTAFLGAAYFSSLELGGMLAFLVLILIHELGHAVLVVWLGHRVTGIDVHAFGGLCHWAGTARQADSALIAWGGVWAQGLLYFAALLWAAIMPPQTFFGAQVLQTFLHTNAWIIGLNLVPIPGLDGSQCWSLFRLLSAGGGSAPPKRRKLNLVVDPGEDIAPGEADSQPPAADEEPNPVFEKILAGLDRPGREPPKKRP